MEGNKDRAAEFRYWNSLKESYKRNMPCICGSGKKYKKCCWLKKET